MLDDIRNNVTLNSASADTRTDIVSNTIMTEYNNMINRHAPCKIVQVKKDYIPYFNEEVRQLQSEANSKLTNAINENDKKMEFIQDV